MTELDGLWLRALEEVTRRAAHEVKDALNGVSLNLEVIRSRLSAPAAAKTYGGVGGVGQSASRLTPFVAAAGDQLEQVVARTEALLFLARPGSEPCDVALTLRHLASLMVPAIKSDGGQLTVEGCGQAFLTAASAMATRLALASAMLAQARSAARSVAHCRMETGSEAVVRFSHESAVRCRLEPAVASAIGRHGIRNEVSVEGTELTLRFPRHS